MDRDGAIRSDGMLISARGLLDAVMFYAKNNVSETDFSRIRRMIGEAMYSTVEISSMLHLAHPDIVPKELTPDIVESRPRPLG